MSDAIAAEKKENTCCLMKILQNVVLLGRQGLALPGDGDDKSRNFYQLMLLRALDDPSLLKWINRSYDRHMSSTSQNEILKLLALKRLRKIVSDIAMTGCYSILADEAIDVSNTQQLVVCIRWVTKDLEVEEDFIGLVPLERAPADVTAAATNDVLMKLSLPISNANTQCHDRCSTVVGSKKGVATIIKQSQPNCLLIHCCCHALNLAVGDAIKNVLVLKESLEDPYELTKLIKYSPKRQAALQRKQGELRIDNLHLTVNTSEQMESPNYSKIRLLYPTRWTVRAKALHCIYNNYKPIQEWLTWCEDRKKIRIQIRVLEPSVC